MIRVLIADDHAVVREGLRAFLALQDDVEVVGEAADGEEAVQAVVRLEPDVALVDLVMPRVDGIEAIGRIRAERPQTRVIVLTSFVDEDKMLPAVRAGAVGYLLKDVAPQELVGAIRTVHGGGTLLHPTVVEELVREVSRDGAAARGAQPADRPRARGADPHRARPGQQGDRLRARRGREDGQDPRQQHPRQARAHRPHAGRALRGPRGPGRRPTLSRS